MNALTSQYPAIMEALGWTLLNSIWQAGALFLAVFILLRLMPMQFSRVRYAVACGALALMVLTSVTTFFIVFESASVHNAQISFNSFGGAASLSQATANDLTFWHLTFQMIEKNMSWILLGWSIGAVVFSLRTVSGWIFLNSIKRQATEVEGGWYDKLQTLATNMGLTRVIRLAESSRVPVPMVTGFFKPVILIPASMLSGLSAMQIETIFVHELAHIRRNDYIINLFQTALESIFFFNPFVWLLSGIIRREREYCCDDEVIRTYGEALEYAHALTLLEEIRLQPVSPALSLAENKNLLFNRIRRIMEKSAKTSFGRERIVPAVLLVVGMVCASWLTIHTEKTEQHFPSTEKLQVPAANVVKQDTVIRDKKSKSKTTFISIDDNGNVREEIIEERDDMAGFDMPDNAFDNAFKPFEFNRAPLVLTAPDLVVPPLTLELVPPGIMVPSPLKVPDVFFRMEGDTIPGAAFYRGYNNEDWQQFSQEFEKKFREQFSDFYKNNEEVFEKMMKEMEISFEKRFEHSEMSEHVFEDAAHARQKMLEAQEHEHRAQEEAMSHMHDLQEVRARGTREGAAARLAEEHGMAARARALHERERELHAVEEANMRAFERGIREMLIEDGYIKSSDEVKRFKYDQNGDIEVNGKKIKKEHEDKYHKLHDKYFKTGFHYWNAE